MSKPETEKHQVEAWVREVGLPSTKYGSHKRSFSRAPIEPRVCLLHYPGIQASTISIRGHILTIYRHWDDVWRSYSVMWTTDYEEVTRYARRRDGHYTKGPCL
jgi:hypothetical protein